MSEISMRAILLENNNLQHPLSPSQIAHKYNRNIKTVYRTLARLREDGVLPRPDATRVPVAARRSSVEPKETAPRVWTPEDVKAILQAPHADKAERLATLAGVLRFGNDAAKVAAAKAIEDIEKGSGQSIGPPDPLTEAEKLARVTLILRAVGPELAQKAWEAAFELQNPQNPHDPEPPDGAGGVEGRDVELRGGDRPPHGPE